MKTAAACVLAMVAAVLAACARQDAQSLPRLTPKVFELAFQGGTIPRGDGKQLKFEPEPLGKLRCPTGRIGAIEPFMTRDLRPFTVSVPPGEYRVSVAIAEDIPGDRRIAFAKITFGSSQPAYWQLAIPEGFDVAKLEPGQVVGYPVDGGIGSFMDEQTAESLDTEVEKVAFNAQLEQQFADQPLKAMIAAGSGNVAVFSTGIGDGRYASYFGFDENGVPVALVTDFEMVEW